MRLTAAFGVALMLALAFTGCNGASGNIEEAMKDIQGGGNDSGGADTVAVEFKELTQQGGGTEGEKTYSTTVLALHFNKTIDGLSASDITLTDTGNTGAEKGDLNGEGPTYTLAVSGIEADGEVNVSVTKTAYSFSPASKKVTVRHGDNEPTEAAFNLMQNGNKDTETTELTLAFDPPIPGLALVTGDEDGVTFNAGETGAEPGNPVTSDGGVTYTLAVSGTKKTANVSVTVKKLGYDFPVGSTKSVTVWGTPESEPGPEQPAPSPIAFASGDNSVIDQITAAKDKASVTITMGTGNEPVQFGTEGFPPTGLELTKDTSPASVTIDGKGYTLDLTGSPADSPLITVGDGVTLTLKNITLKGLKDGGTGDSGDNTRALIRVDGGHLVLEAGAVISDNTGTGAGAVDSNNWGGGVRVDGGTFTMKGGEVRGNKAVQAAGVYITNGGKFEMSGGTISGNEVDGGGGGVRVANGTFTMTAGAISGNKGDYSGGGVEVEKDGTFTMTGGKISGNMSLGTLDYNAIGGGGRGGGLFVSGGKAIMQGNAVIENNTAVGSSGAAGVAISSSGTFTMRENAVIRNNTANGGTDSGGVAVWSNSTFTMEGGTISGNSVTNVTSGVGGGVYVNKDSGQFSKTGGIIYGNNAETSLQNTASGGGHAVAVGPVDNPTKKRNGTADVDLHWPLKGDGTDSHWDTP